MASTAKISIPLSDPDRVIQIPLSDYVRKLDEQVRERYLKKISAIGIDPVLIDEKRFDLIAYRGWNRRICSAIWFSRLAIIRKNNLRANVSMHQTNNSG